MPYSQRQISKTLNINVFLRRIFKGLVLIFFFVVLNITADTIIISCMIFYVAWSYGKVNTHVSVCGSIKAVWLWSIVLGEATRPVFSQPPTINRRQEGRLTTTFAVLRLYTNSRNSPFCVSLVKEWSMYSTSCNSCSTFGVNWHLFCTRFSVLV